MRDVPRLGRLTGAAGIAAWFNGRDQRERVLIAVGGLVVALYAGWMGVYQPLSTMRVNALADIRMSEAISASVAANGASLARPAGTAATAPTVSVITDSASAVGLVIRRLEPEGERTWIELDEADFSVLVQWLALLESDHALRVATLEVDRKPVPGIVSARISVEN